MYRLKITFPFFFLGTHKKCNIPSFLIVTYVYVYVYVYIF